MYIKKFKKNNKYIKAVKLDVTKFKIPDEPILGKCLKILSVTSSIGRKKYRDNLRYPFGELTVLSEVATTIEDLHHYKKKLKACYMSQEDSLSPSGRYSFIDDKIFSVGSNWSYIRNNSFLKQKNKLGIKFMYVGHGVAIINIKNKEFRHLNIYTKEERIIPYELVKMENKINFIKIRKTYMIYSKLTTIGQSYYDDAGGGIGGIQRYIKGWNFGKKYRLYVLRNILIVMRLKDLKMLALPLNNIAQYVPGGGTTMSFAHCNNDYMLVSQGFWWRDYLSNHTRRTLHLNFAVFHMTEKGILYICNMQLGNLLNSVSTGYISFLDYIIINGKKYKPAYLDFDNLGIYTKVNGKKITIYDYKNSSIYIEKLPLFADSKKYKTSLTVKRGG